MRVSPGRQPRGVAANASFVPLLAAGIQPGDPSEERSDGAGKRDVQRVVAGRKGGVKEAVAELLRPGGHFSPALQAEAGVRISEVFSHLVSVLHDTVKKDTVRRHIGEFVQSNYLRRGDHHVFFAGEAWRSWGGELRTAQAHPAAPRRAPPHIERRICIRYLLVVAALWGGLGRRPPPSPRDLHSVPLALDFCPPSPRARPFPQTR